MRHLTIATFLFAFSIQSCTVYFKTADVDSNFKSNVNEIDNGVATLTSQFQEALKTYNDIPCEKNSSTLEHINSTQELVKQDFDVLKKRQADIHSTYENFREYSSGKEQISSKSPEWDMLKKSRHDMKSQLDAFSESNSKLVKDAGTFMKTVQTEYIDKLQVVDIPSYTLSYRKSLEVGLNAEKDLKLNFQDFKSKANVYITSNKNSNPSECEKIASAIEQYEIQIQNLSNVLSSLEKAFHTFEKQSKSLPATLYSCSPLYQTVKDNEEQLALFQTSLNDIQTKMNEISAGLSTK